MTAESTFALQNVFLTRPFYLNFPTTEYGFDTHTLEEVAFLSDQTFLSLSSDEIMIFRKLGDPSPPSPTPYAVEKKVQDKGNAKRKSGVPGVYAAPLGKWVSLSLRVFKIFYQIS